jgi:hypothetical protein
MTPILKQEHENASVPRGRRYVYLLTTIAGANTGFMLGLLATLSWPECLMLMLALGSLAGGAVFTFFEMRDLS